MISFLATEPPINITPMLVSRSREKLLNALIYFSENVRHPGKTKLFKLLNYLDFLHFEETGRSVTGLEYHAWKNGPVPVQLFEELQAPKRDFVEHLVKRTVQAGGYERHELMPRKKFDASLFSGFEMELMAKLCKRHFNHSADDMSEMSHFETGPWQEVWEVNGDQNGHIGYDLVLRRRGNTEDLELLDYAKELREFEERYS